jgi:hypothetical protein
MTLAPDEFIRGFLLHVLPKGFHRIRHYGLLSSVGCKANIAHARELIAGPGTAVPAHRLRDHSCHRGAARRRSVGSLSGHIKD